MRSKIGGRKFWVALLLVACARAQNTPSAFAGARACGACHADIFKKQDSSNHARSLRAPSEIGDLYQPLPFQFLDRSSQATLTFRKTDHDQLELDARKGDQHDMLVLRWAFGSGARGITPVGVHGNATIVESRLSWYPSEHAYSLTPGATKNDPQTATESLGRTLLPEEAQQCFSCHTTDYNSGPAGPALNQMGIHCERCHGAGLEHIRLMSKPEGPVGAQDRKILNPGRLKAFAQLEMCGACHGKPPRDTDLSALQFLERTPQTARFPSRRLVLSRCFNESEGLKCTHCHDPHANVSERRAQRDASCINCHSESLRSKARNCPVQQSDCVSCHMPKERVVLHSEFTDHWIRVVRSK